MKTNVVYEWSIWGKRSFCNLCLIKKPDYNIVVVSEREDNPGISILDSAEILVESVIEKYSLDPKRTFYIEHSKTFDHGQWHFVLFDNLYIKPKRYITDAGLIGSLIEIKDWSEILRFLGDMSIRCLYRKPLEGVKNASNNK
jgi:hypothetical protein